MSKTDPPKPFLPVPSARQLNWHNMEFYGFLHFTTNTFTDREWGNGDEDEAVFNPTDFDADQIVSTAKSAGMKGLILTCKHHDGFCLWPTKTTTHNVSKSPFKRDVVKLISDSCKKHGLKFGIYLSPWDRNNSEYGRPGYIEIYRAQLKELLTNYGDIFEVWHDGANGGDGFYGGAREKRTIDPRTYYDWPNTWNMVRKLAPNAVIFSDVGPDLRWVGNENGYAGDPCWSTYTPVEPNGGSNPAPGYSRWQDGEQGTRFGKFWIPAECDVSIRPGWFWHAREDSHVKSPQELKALYFKSVGRGASFLLNIPPNRQGRISKEDVESLKGFRKLIDAIFDHPVPRPMDIFASHVRTKEARYSPSNLWDSRKETYWGTPDSAKNPTVTYTFASPIGFNTVRLREAISLGQRIDKFKIEIMKNNQWVEVFSGTSIGNCRLVAIPTCNTNQVRLSVTESSACPCLSEFRLYLDPSGRTE